MPAVARKVAPESHQNHRTASERVAARGGSTLVKAAPRNRWHESPPGKTQRGSRSTPARDQENDSTDLRGLLDHFSGENAARTEQKQKEIETRRLARKRARLRHRPFRLTILATVMAGAPLAILACLLWMRSSALALSREDASLQNKIAATRSELEQTRQEISAIKASPQVEQWAKERGWRRAGQNDFDEVSRILKVVPGGAQVPNSDVP